jgi:hypothetical protein
MGIAQAGGTAATQDLCQGASLKNKNSILPIPASHLLPCFTVLQSTCHYSILYLGVYLFTVYTQHPPPPPQDCEFCKDMHFVLIIAGPSCLDRSGTKRELPTQLFRMYHSIVVFLCSIKHLSCTTTELSTLYTVPCSSS